MSPTATRRTARLIAATAASVAVAMGLGMGPAAASGAMPQTREHVLLAVSVDPTASTGGEICTDWTNEDGTHGTNCPEPSGGGGSYLGGWIEVNSFQ